mgnify:FL=1
MKLSPKIFDFFKDLKNNNNRVWFLKNKSSFNPNQEQVKIFGEMVKDRLNNFDNIDKFKLFRIYRDVRFSKNKTPYKTHFGLTWHRTKPKLRGGYYLHIENKRSFLACGFWAPIPQDLKRIRDEISHDSRELKSILFDNEFQSVWGQLKGDEVKTAPRGFDKNHPDIELIKKKQYILTINLTNNDVCSENFIERIEQVLFKVKPFVDYMSEVLTTDDNGEPLFE